MENKMHYYELIGSPLQQYSYKSFNHDLQIKQFFAIQMMYLNELNVAILCATASKILNPFRFESILTKFILRRHQKGEMSQFFQGVKEYQNDNAMCKNKTRNWQQFVQKPNFNPNLLG